MYVLRKTLAEGVCVCVCVCACAQDAATAVFFDMQNLIMAAKKLIWQVVDAEIQAAGEGANLFPGQC